MVLAVVGVLLLVALGLAAWTNRDGEEMDSRGYGGYGGYGGYAAGGLAGGGFDAGGAAGGGCDGGGAGSC